MFVFGFISLFILNFCRHNQSLASDLADFSSPKAKYCFSSKTFSNNFPPIMLDDSKNQIHNLDVTELEQSLLDKNGNVQYLSSSFCDGNEITDCSECYRQVAQMLLNKQKAFYNSHLRAPRDNMTLIVVGAGPTGLRAAIEAKMMGYNVSLVESREEFTRGKNIGMFSMEERFLSSLGMPGSMRSQYIGFLSGSVIKKKATMPLKIKQKFLWQIAQKLGVTTYLGCEVVAQPTVHRGVAQIVPSQQGRKCARTEYGDEKVLIQDIFVSFDKLVVANGARSKLRDVVMKSPKVNFNEIALNMLRRVDFNQDDLFEPDNSEQSYYNSFMKPDSGGKGGFNNLKSYLSSGNKVRTDSLVFVSDTNARLFGKGVVVPNINPFNMGSNWAVLPMYKMIWSNQHECDLVETRWHFEGNLPREIKYHDKTLDVKKDIIDPQLAHVDLKHGFLANFSKKLFSLFSLNESVDETEFNSFIDKECGKDRLVDNGITFFNIDTMSTTMTDLKGETVTLAGKLDYSDAEYFVVGDAFQDPWYSFGVGQHDGTMGVKAIHKALSSQSYLEEASKMDLIEFERVMRRRVIQILLHIFNTENEDKSSKLEDILLDIYQKLETGTLL